MLRYGYDELGQLVREDNRYTGKSYTWTYDNAGNILNRKTYAYTIDALGTVQNTVIYGYDTGSWGDLLISFNGQSIAYDGIGNPGTWNGSALTWQGRRLMSYGSNTYTYNADGIRTSKTVNGVEHIYHLSGTRILDEEWTDGNIRHLMVYVYDASGQPIGISHYTYNGTIVSENYYLLVSNIQGDIIGIYDSNGTRVVTYVYDAWGRILSTTGTGANTIGVYNPFRYRGYYYDTETSLYYLNSRYYDPNVGRFLNADGSVNANGDLLGFNMFAYCSNNPVSYIDYCGSEKMPFDELKWPGEIHEFVVERIAGKMNWKMEVVITTYGRADLVDVVNKAVYEVKPVSYMYSPILRSAANAQVWRYRIGLTVTQHVEYSLGTENISETNIPYNGYLVNYWSGGSGLIFYSFRRDKSKAKVTVPAVVPVPEKNREKVSQRASEAVLAGAIAGGIYIAASQFYGGSHMRFAFDNY